MDDAAERAAALLTEERRLLLAGDLGGLATLLPQKEALAEALRGMKMTVADLEALRRDTARNRALLDAARNGLEAARARIDDIREASQPRTYSRRGERRCLDGASGGKLERRA
ncbi:hypothetical protein E2L08_05270 [Palleronia sediminis]|uniref:FlgN protein n=1 Tax=Palleronia sediminis TaxID=2547833 RepID=A0A4R6ACI3_9RHOB|nr:hypothetical protein [Palleronia sediminis]TDL81530.1 hypothetical protein E2L08_05270 [Palleronia sediminis]